MVAADVTRLAVMVVTGGSFGIYQRAGQQIGDALVGVAGAARVELDAGLGQGRLGAGADAAADQAVHAVGCQKARQGAVAAAVGGHHLGIRQSAVHDVIDLELFRVAEVAVHIAVFIGDCDFHGVISFLCAG